VEKKYLAVEDLDVYRKLCPLHIEDSELTHSWPAEERYELGSQVRRSSNRSPAQLAEKNDDRHVRNKIEGVNRSRGEAGETVHHLFVALLKTYITQEVYQIFRDRYKECIRMLNGLEKTPEKNSRPKTGAGKLRRRRLATVRKMNRSPAAGRPLQPDT